MTKAQALKLFKSEYNLSAFKFDRVALREAWNNYTDSLCKDRLISSKQYNNWTNPF